MTNVRIAVLAAVAAVSLAAPASADTGHHRGWCKPRNPHHVTCVRHLPPSVNPPPVGPWPGGPVPRFPSPR